MTRRLFVALSGFVLSTIPLLGADVPRQSPEFVIRQPNGQQILLSQFRGKVIALEFLLTTCPHCQNCSALLEKMQKEYGPRGFQAAGVAFNEMSNMLVPDYVRDLHLTFPVGFSSRDPVLEYLQHSALERMLVPQLVFIDRKGVIRAQYSGDNPWFQDEESNMRKQIEALLKEPAAARKAAPKPRKAAVHKSNALR